jgi:putative transposase
VILALIAAAVAAGARRDKACAVLGLSARAVARWSAAGGGSDQRRGPGRPPSQKLSPEERRRVLETANSPAYRDLSPRQIVPRLADKGEYIASEATFYRVLREAGLLAHRARSRPGSSRKPNAHVASAPNQVWSWDITYLRSTIRGVFYYLYLVVDIWSRKIVGWDVQADETATHAAKLIERTTLAEQVDAKKLVLHSDNGGPMKGSTMLVTLQRLGVVPSFSRPRVSDDNPFIEALFRTLKYRPSFPSKPFGSLADVRAWVELFVRWYNDEHLHSALRYVSPADRHARRDTPILAQRRTVYAAARARHRNRWSGAARNWTPIGDVYLNPVKHLERTPPIASPIVS